MGPGHSRPGTLRGQWLVRRVNLPRERTGSCRRLHRADLLQVLVDAASDADVRTGQRVTVMVQHDWSGEFANNGSPGCGLRWWPVRSSHLLFAVSSRSVSPAW